MTTQRGFDSDEVARQRARKSGGNAKHVVVTTPEQWAEALPAVIERFKADMAARYEEEA